MAKPSSKRKTGQKRRNQAPAAKPATPVEQPAAAKPAEDMVQAEVLQQPVRPDAETPNPAPPTDDADAAPETAPEVTLAEGPAEAPGGPEAPQAEAPAAPAPRAEEDAPAPPAPPESASAPEPSATRQKVRIGNVDGVLVRLPLTAVQEVLGERAHAKIAAIRANPAAIGDLQKRMRATDGRCAPVIFTIDGDKPSLFDGTKQIAAAMNIGLAAIDVVMIAAGDAGAVQSYLAQLANRKPPESEDDLYVRALVHHDEE